MKTIKCIAAVALMFSSLCFATPSSKGADEAAHDLVIDVIFAPWTNPAETGELMEQLKNIPNVSPQFLSEMLFSLHDYSDWRAGSDPKDVLLDYLPKLAELPGFKNFKKHPMYEQIRDQVRALRKFTTKPPGNESRAFIFDRISQAFGFDNCEELLKPAFQWPEPPPRAKFN